VAFLREWAELAEGSDDPTLSRHHEWWQARSDIARRRSPAVPRNRRSRRRRSGAVHVRDDRHGPVYAPGVELNVGRMSRCIIRPADSPVQRRIHRQQVRQVVPGSVLEIVDHLTRTGRLQAGLDRE